MHRLIVLLAATGLLSACDAGTGTSTPPPVQPGPSAARIPAGPPPVQGFAHQAGTELFGFYLPVSEVRIENLKLSHLHVGDEMEFSAWEQAQGRGDTNFAPVMFQFDDLSSPTIANELGGQTPEVIVRVLPAAYGVSDSVVRFVGFDATLGEVRFEGQFVPAAFARARQGDSVGEPVLTGTLTIGDRVFEGQSFTWTGGD